MLQVLTGASRLWRIARAAAAGIDTLHVSSVTLPNSDALDAAICDATASARRRHFPGWVHETPGRTHAGRVPQADSEHPSGSASQVRGARECSEIACSKRCLTRVSPSPVRRCTSWIPSATPGPYASGLCPRSSRDTVEFLRARVQAFEREAVVKTLAAMASGELAFG